MKKKILEKDELLKKGGKTVNEFKEFIARGNVVDLAVGVVIGSAFGNIVSSVVNDFKLLISQSVANCFKLILAIKNQFLYSYWYLLIYILQRK